MIDEKNNNENEDKKEVNKIEEDKKIDEIENSEAEKTEESEETEELEIVKGTAKDLKISPVYDHIKSDRIPGSEKKENIVIPKSSNSDK